MNQDLQTLIEKARKMSPSEQVELIAALFQSLSHIPYPKSSPVADFEKSLTIEDIIQSQKTKPVTDIANLAADFWPDEESADDIIAYIYQQRQEDRLKH